MLQDDQIRIKEPVDAVGHAAFFLARLLAGGYRAGYAFLEAHFGEVVDF
jgi:hypothetical protein